jgi:bifunctional UDP-N-acetylglucosamine pyrophosphorylase/glucosamine-1-phosphate N-acetyltransferase
MIPVLISLTFCCLSLASFCITIEKLLVKARKSGFSLLSVVLDDPSGYGRIIRDTNGLIQSIVEQKDASERQQNVKEINTG